MTISYIQDRTYRHAAGKAFSLGRSAIAGMTLSLSIAVLVVLVSLSSASAVDSPIQSPARPFGLSIMDKVQLAGSDARSAVFQSSYLPLMEQWGNMNLTSPSFTQLTSTIALDPSMISIATQYDARLYFIGDNTWKHTSLGFNTSGGGVTSGDPKLIFPDASESTSLVMNKITKKKELTRTSTDPLLAGDFVNLGTLSSGTMLDFFLISKRTKRITDVFSTDVSINPDGLSHAVFFAKPDSPYLFIGFEDMYGKTSGGSNSALFALDIGMGNIHALTNMPEPSTMLVLGSFLMLVIYRKRTLDLERKSQMT